MKNDLGQAMLLMPQHREQHKKSRQQTLDDLIDGQRSSGNLSSSAFDFLMMAYRYQFAFQAELSKFLKKPLKPQRIEDLLSLAFAALISRREEQESGIVYWTVELCKEEYGNGIVPMVNAFCRQIQRDKNKIISAIEENPEILLGKDLSNRWKSNPALLRKNGLKLMKRPETGIEGFDSELTWQRHPVEVLEQSKFQAMNKASWDFCTLCFDEINQHFKQNEKLSILDACAAPGAKLIRLTLELSKSHPDSEFTATDAKFNRLERLKDNLSRWDLTDTVKARIFSWGEQRKWKRDTPHNVILADLPCSGSGTISERPDLLNKDFKREVAILANIQQNILEQLLSELDNNGLIFVSICSVDQEEIDFISKTLKAEPVYDTRSAEQWQHEDLVGWFLVKNDTGEVL